MLSDAEKRRQYDTQGHQSFKSSSNKQGFSGFHFDMNEFFRQFDAASSQFHTFQHEAHHQAHFKNHHKAHQQAHNGHFHFDFGSLFDDDEIFSGASAKDGFKNFNFGNVFSGAGSQDPQKAVHSSSFTHQTTKHQTCRTVTKREGNRVSTITECH